MDIVNHSVAGFLLVYIPTNNIPIGVVSGLLATIPDLWNPESIIKSDNWDWKNKIHNFKHWLSFVPPITLHVALDKLCHGEGKRWYASDKWYEYLMPWKWRERMWMETISWVINIILLKWQFA